MCMQPGKLLQLLADHNDLCNMQYADVKNLSVVVRKLLSKILELVTISLRLEERKHHNSENNCGQNNVYSLYYMSVFI